VWQGTTCSSAYRMIVSGKLWHHALYECMMFLYDLIYAHAIRL
jgi:hypothetical protein